VLLREVIEDIPLLNAGQSAKADGKISGMEEPENKFTIVLDNLRQRVAAKPRSMKTLTEQRIVLQATSRGGDRGFGRGLEGRWAYQA
jgi:hypothetical protein